MYKPHPTNMHTGYNTVPSSDNSSPSTSSMTSTFDRGAFSAGKAFFPSRRMQCKGRGVSGDHNARTAYFDIPSNAQHGMLLVCSHPVCAKSGRCFRYCAVCDIPVAKRNFPMRHAHGLTKKDGELRSTMAIENVNTSPLAGSKRQRSVGFDSDVVPSSVAFTAMTSIPEPFQLVNSVNTPTTFNDYTAESSEGKVKMQLTATESKWLALFHNRPSSVENMEAVNQWMDSVLKLASKQVDSPFTYSCFRGSSVADGLEAPPDAPVQAASTAYSAPQDDLFFPFPTGT